MPISINSNTIALQASKNLQLTSASFTQAVQRLSSGLRINSAADDPAGLGLSQKLVAQINGFDQAQRNTQDAISLLQTAQSGITETMADLQRLNQLAIQASNGTLTSSDLQNIQLEAQGLVQDIDRVAQQTKFNTMALLNGALGASVSGGGPNITNIQVQAGLTPAGTYSLTAATVATQSTITGSVQSAGSFTGGGSITITGPTGVSQTFTTFAGESVSNFLSQVNDAGLGVTASINTGTNKYQIISNNFGVKGAGANAVTNPTGPQLITATGSDTDFGSAGAALGLVPNGGGTTTGSNPNNAQISFGGALNVPLTGLNTDQFAGTGVVAGVSFQIIDPGAITPNLDSITVTQNAALEFQVGANSGQTISLEVDAQTSAALGVNAIDLTTQASAETGITTVQDAITQLTATQTNLGALQATLTNIEIGRASCRERV